MRNASKHDGIIISGGIVLNLHVGVLFVRGEVSPLAAMGEGVFVETCGLHVSTNSPRPYAAPPSCGGFPRNAPIVRFRTIYDVERMRKSDKKRYNAKFIRIRGLSSLRCDSRYGTKEWWQRPIPTSSQGDMLREGQHGVLMVENTFLIPVEKWQT